MTEGKLKHGIIAGFVATIVLSILMIAKMMMGVMPDMNPIQDIVTVSDSFTGMQLPLPAGWIGHFFIGSVVWGIFYALIEGNLPASPLIKGLVFGFIAWMAMMIVFMPLAGQGIFGIRGGMPVPVATLILHLVYGAVLGIVFARLSRKTA